MTFAHLRVMKYLIVSLVTTSFHVLQNPTYVVFANRLAFQAATASGVGTRKAIQCAQDKVLTLKRSRDNGREGYGSDGPKCERALREGLPAHAEDFELREALVRCRIAMCQHLGNSSAATRYFRYKYSTLCCTTHLPTISSPHPRRPEVFALLTSSPLLETRKLYRRSPWGATRKFAFCIT